MSVVNVVCMYAPRGGILSGIPKDGLSIGFQVDGAPFEYSSGALISRWENSADKDNPAVTVPTYKELTADLTPGDELVHCDGGRDACNMPEMSGDFSLMWRVRNLSTTTSAQTVFHNRLTTTSERFAVYMHRDLMFIRSGSAYCTASITASGAYWVCYFERSGTATSLYASSTTAPSSPASTSTASTGPPAGALEIGGQWSGIPLGVIPRISHLYMWPERVLTTQERDDAFNALLNWSY
jgi:hypothetical protein